MRTASPFAAIIAVIALFLLACFVTWSYLGTLERQRALGSRLRSSWNTKPPESYTKIT